MGKRDLPNVYALARGHGHIYQAIPIAHVISHIYTTKVYTTSDKSKKIQTHK